MYISRREAVIRLAALAASTASACAPIRLALGSPPRSGVTGDASAEATLEAFAHTVAPGVADGHACTRVFADPFYRFARYREFFLSDLDHRAARRAGRPFAALDRADRVAVISEGLAAGAVAGRLYAGAVFLTQIAAYGRAGTDGARPVALGFDSAPMPPDRAALTYPDPGRFLPAPLTTSGNPW